MSELMVYQKVADPERAVKEWGHSIALSGIFNLENKEQGEVFALECLTRQMPPLMLAQRYHVIHKRLSMKAEAMLDGFTQAGGKVKILSRTPDKAAIELTIDGETQQFSLTWEETQQEPFAYDGKESEIVKLLAAGKKPPIKPKYATPRSRMQMMWARVVSDGVRVMKPGVNCGVYTPEETGDFAGQEANGHAAPPQEDAVDVEFTPATAAEPAAAEAPAQEPEPQESPQEEAPPAKAATPPANGQASAEQVARVKELWGLLGITPAQRDKQLASRNCSVARNLTAEQAAELTGKLEAVLAKRQAADEPCGPELTERVRQAVVEANQQVPGIAAHFKGKMAEAGLQKIEELSRGDAENLIACLAGDELKKFIGESLWRPTKKKD